MAEHDKKRNAHLIGCHLSIAGGVHRSVERAVESSCTAFQIFTRNPRGWAAAQLGDEETEKFRAGIASTNLFPVAHMPYLPNLAAPDEKIYAKSVEQLTSELERCRILGIKYLVTHLGSHLGFGEEGGRRRIVAAIKSALNNADSDSIILMENTAGTRNSLGTTPDDLARIFDALDGHERVGICIDTAHAFAAGYDWRSGSNRFYEEIKTAGLAGRIRLIHLNDSKVSLDGRADRHEHIGLGCIGSAGLKRVVNNELFKGLPVILETPVDERRDDRGNVAEAKKLFK